MMKSMRVGDLVFYIVGIFLSIIFVGDVLGYSWWSSIGTNIPTGKNATFFGIVLTDPTPAGNFLMIDVKLMQPYHGEITLFLSSNSQIHYGDMIWIQGTVTASTEAGEYPAAFLPQTHFISGGHGSMLVTWAIAVRSWIIRQCNRLFSSDEATLLAAIITGSSAGLSKDFKTQMDASGTSYIVGMYGYKIAIVLAAIAAILKERIPRWMIFIISLIATWTLVMVSGGSISALRAGIMGSATLITSFLGQLTKPRNTLTLTAFFMATINPTILIDASFQLSFLSFFGIYYLRYPINALFNWRDPGFLHWKEHAMLSITTNLAILPVAMRTFGDFSITSFISNILIMIPWLLIFVFGFAIIALNTLFAPVTFLLTQIIHVLLSYEFLVIRMFAWLSLPFPAIFNSSVTVAGYYLALIFFVYYYGERSKSR